MERAADSIFEILRDTHNLKEERGVGLWAQVLLGRESFKYKDTRSFDLTLDSKEEGGMRESGGRG